LLDLLVVVLLILIIKNDCQHYFKFRPNLLKN
jgi:hypothetical protein